MSIRVLMVDDHPLFRDGLRVYLEQHADIHLVGEVDTAASAVRMASELCPDVVLVDWSLSDEGAVEVTQQIVAQHPHARVIALAEYDSVEMLTAMARAGAHGYVLKRTHPDELARAIRTVVAQGAALGSEVLPDLLQQFRRLSRAGGASSQLSSRELDILRLLASGSTNREIAGQLALSVQTVKNLLSELYGKLGVSNRTEAAVVALNKGTGNAAVMPNPNAPSPYPGRAGDVPPSQPRIRRHNPH